MRYPWLTKLGMNFVACIASIAFIGMIAYAGGVDDFGDWNLKPDEAKAVFAKPVSANDAQDFGDWSLFQEAKSKFPDELERPDIGHPSTYAEQLAESKKDRRDIIVLVGATRLVDVARWGDLASKLNCHFAISPIREFQKPAGAYRIGFDSFGEHRIVRERPALPSDDMANAEEVLSTIKAVNTSQASQTSTPQTSQVTSWFGEGNVTCINGRCYRN